MNSSQSVNVCEYLKYIAENNKFIMQNSSLKSVFNKILDNLMLVENKQILPLNRETFFPNYLSDGILKTKDDNHINFDFNNQILSFYLIDVSEFKDNVYDELPMSQYSCCLVLDQHVIFYITDESMRLYLNDCTKNFIDNNNLNHLNQYFINSFSKYILPETLTDLVHNIREISYAYISNHYCMGLVYNIYYNNTKLYFGMIFDDKTTSYKPTDIYMEYPYEDGCESWQICEYGEDTLVLVINPYHIDLVSKYIPFVLFDEIRCCITISNNDKNIVACNNMWNTIRTMLTDNKYTQIKKLETVLMDSCSSITAYQNLDKYFENYPSDIGSVTHQCIIRDSSLQDKLPSKINIGNFELELELYQPAE